jgi:hypothetical protein
MPVMGKDNVARINSLIVVQGVNAAVMQTQNGLDIIFKE